MFRERHQPDQHNLNGKRSLFEDLVYDLIQDVTLDYVHLVCICVYKKTLEERINGKFDNVRLPATSILAISSFRNGIPRYIPHKNFARLPRPLVDSPRWEATEYRLDLSSRIQGSFIRCWIQALNALTRCHQVIDSQRNMHRIGFVCKISFGKLCRLGSETVWPPIYSS